MRAERHAGCGETLLVETSRASWSALDPKRSFPRGHMRFGPTQKSGINAAGLIAFLKRSIVSAKQSSRSAIVEPPAP
jgi:hypothetical protein